MQPTLDIGDRVLVNRLAYQSGGPAPGDGVGVTQPLAGRGPQDGPLQPVQAALARALGNAPPGTEHLIKRVVGVPGDVMEARGGKLVRNGAVVDEFYLPEGTVTDGFGPVTIPAGTLWVMGDNRGNSADSRVFGAIPQDAVVGRATVLVWPFDSVETL